MASQSGVDRAAAWPSEEVRSLPSRMYWDPAIFEAERALFARSWTSVARVEDVARPGDYVAVDVAGEPVVVVRDRAGFLQGLANVCRHRGTTIVEGAGNAKALQCPHHLWTYGLDGNLLGAPGMRGVPGFRAEEHCLPRVGVETWQGWVFVNLDPDAAPVAPLVTGLDGICEEYSLAAMQRVGRIHYPSPWNWKISVENFAESYHHAGAHPRTLQPWTPGERSRVVDGGAQPWLSLDHESMTDQEPFTVHVVFPHHMFSIVRPAVMTWFNLRPVAVDAVDLAIELFVRPELADRADLVDALVAGARAVNDEDVEVNRRTQEGMRSRFATSGPVHPLEEGCGRFRRWLLDQLSSTTADSPLRDLTGAWPGS